jgi:hypothetical protein
VEFTLEPLSRILALLTIMLEAYGAALLRFAFARWRQAAVLCKQTCLCVTPPPKSCSSGFCPASQHVLVLCWALTAAVQLATPAAAAAAAAADKR